MNEPPRPLPADFGDAWAVLEPQLRRSLATAPPNVVDDVLQETSIKLLRVWDSIDHDRPALPLAVTIARNALRDELRRTARHSHLELSEEARVRDDLDAVVSARLQLARVETELTRLTPAQRAALLTEVGGGPRPPDTPRVKMLRSRARARLRELVAQAGGFVVTGVARLRSSAAGRVSAGVPDIGILAQALLVAVVAAGSAASIAGAPEARPERLAVGKTAAQHTGAQGARRNDAPIARPKAAVPGTNPRALAVADPSNPSQGGGVPPGPGLPAAPIPRSHGGVHDEGHFGTEGYAFAQSGGNSAAGHDVGWRYESAWETPACVQRLAEGQSPGPCGSPGAPSAEVEVEVDGRRHRVGTDGSRR